MNSENIEYIKFNSSKEITKTSRKFKGPLLKANKKYAKQRNTFTVDYPNIKLESSDFTDKSSLSEELVSKPVLLSKTIKSNSFTNQTVIPLNNNVDHIDDIDLIKEMDDNDDEFDENLIDDKATQNVVSERCNDTSQSVTTIPLINLNKSDSKVNEIDNSLSTLSLEDVNIVNEIYVEKSPISMKNVDQTHINSKLQLKKVSIIQLNVTNRSHENNKSNRRQPTSINATKFFDHIINSSDNESLICSDSDSRENQVNDLLQKTFKSLNTANKKIIKKKLRLAYKTLNTRSDNTDVKITIVLPKKIDFNRNFLRITHRSNHNLWFDEINNQVEDEDISRGNISNYENIESDWFDRVITSEMLDSISKQKQTYLKLQNEKKQYEYYNYDNTINTSSINNDIKPMREDKRKVLISLRNKFLKPNNKRVESINDYSHKYSLTAKRNVKFLSSKNDAISFNDDSINDLIRNRVHRPDDTANKMVDVEITKITTNDGENDYFNNIFQANPSHVPHKPIDKIKSSGISSPLNKSRIIS